MTPGAFFDVTLPGASTPVVGLPLSNAIAVSPDGAFFAIPGNDDIVYRVAVKDRTVTPLGVALGPGNTLSAAAVVPNGAAILVTQNSATSRVVAINASTGAEMFQWPTSSGVTLSDIALSGEDAYVYALSPNTSTVQVLSLSTNTWGSPLTVPVGFTPVALAVSSGGRFIYVAANNGVNGRIYQWDRVMGVSSNPDSTSPLTDQISSISLAYDGTLFVARTSNTLVTYDASSQTFGTSAPTGSFAARVGVTGDISRVVVGQGLLVGAMHWVHLADPSLTFSGVGTSAPTGTLGTFITPSILEGVVQTPGVTALSNLQLTTLGFGRYITFNGGRLDFGADVTTSRNLRLLGSAQLMLGGHDSAISGETVGAEPLFVNGPGSLQLEGANGQSSTIVSGDADLTVERAHPGMLQLSTSIAHLGANVGALDVTGSVVRLDAKGTATTVTATGAAFTAGSVLGLRIFTDSGNLTCDRLGSSGTLTFAADTQLTLSHASGTGALPGASCILVENISSTFVGRPEGTQVTLGGQAYTLSYVGGDGNDLTLTRPAVINLPPSILGYANQTVEEGQPVPPTNVIIGDDTTPAAQLTLTATSSNQTLLPDANLLLSGTDNNRTIQATPAAGVTGQTTITLSVGDGTHTTTRTYTLTVDPTPQDPAITYSLAEGAIGGFFNTDVLIVNPHQTATPARVEVTGTNGQVVARDLVLEPLSRYTLHIADLTELQDTTFSTQVISSTGKRLAVERTMWWDTTAYGSHTERASEGASRRHYFAEGAQGFFKTYFLLQNPSSTANTARLTFMLEGGGTLTREYPLPTAGRLTVDAGDIEELRGQAFSTAVSFQHEAFAERAMYFGAQPFFAGGSAAAGVSTLAQEWLLAEGATGSFFSTYILAMNPGTDPVEVQLSYLRETGGVIATTTHTIPAEGRLTIDPVNEAPELAATTFATRIASGGAIAVERSMYWPKPEWTESHASTGTSVLDYEWALAEGRVGGVEQWQTFVLLANPNESEATVTLRFVRDPREHGGQPQEPIVKTVTVPGLGRVTVGVAGTGSDVPALADESFGVVIDSNWPIAVERSMYASPNGAVWSSGTNAPATNLFGRGPG